MNKNDIHIFVGDCDEDLAKAARSCDPTAFLIDSAVYQKLKKGQLPQQFVAYTSLSDLPKITADDSPLWTLLNIADKITYHPPAVWSDHQAVFDHWSAQSMTEFLLDEINRQKNNVNGLNLEHYVSTDWLPVREGRLHEGPHVWVAGCSISHGVGVADHQRYGHLIAERLDRPARFLTKGASSIPWAADQLLRADIQADDLVIWGITSEYRQTSLINNRIVHRQFWSRDASDRRDIHDTENFFYLGLTSLHQVRNHINRIGARLVLLPLLCSENIKLRLRHCPEYCAVPYTVRYLDLGADREHPGPQQHQAYADLVCNFLEQHHG